MSKNQEENKSYKSIIFASLFTIIGIWIGGWLFADYSEITNQPVNDIFGSLSALFGGLAFAGVIISIYMQLDELKDTRRELAETAKSNKLLVNEAKEKAILELYQTYCSERFQIIKTSSFRILISTIQNKDYADFMISRFFVVSSFKLTEEIASKLPIYKEDLKISYDSFKDKEQFDRFRLDELINFFILLSEKNSSKEVIKNCDFFYDWWRPLFWFISELQITYYNEEGNESLRKYSKPHYLRQVVEKLDAIYEHKSFETSSEVWEYILEHPKIKSYSIDERYISSVKSITKPRNQ